MAVLSDEDRAKVTAALEKLWSSRRDSIGISHQDLRAAVDAQDVWLNDNAASANQAVPEPAKSTLGTQLKAELFVAIVRERYL